MEKTMQSRTRVLNLALGLTAFGAVAEATAQAVDGAPMQGLIARLSSTPGALHWAGRALDAYGDDVRAHGWR